MKENSHNKKHTNEHPSKPCSICIAQAVCNIGKQMLKCPAVMDYYNAIYFKDPSHICTFNINGHGVWQVFVTGRSDKRTAEAIVKLSEGKSMHNGPVFDYKKHLEYTKHLEALEYYDLL